MKLRVSDVTPDSLNVDAATNLPDGTVVKLLISRANRGSGADVLSSWAIDDVVEATVEDGHARASLVVDEGDLRAVASADPVTAVDKDLTVCASVQTGADFNGIQRQPDENVRNEIGENGEALKTSPGAKEFGALTDHPSWWIERQTTAAVPPSASTLSAIESAQGSPVVVEPMNGWCAF